MKRFYGANPLQLLALLASFALAAYAALLASYGPLPIRMGIWFVGAVIAHDLVLFPLYALAERSLGLVTRRRGRREPDASINYLRVPLMFSGLLLLTFFPLILRQSVPTYRAASGLNEQPFLGRWLFLTGVAFLVSAVVLAARAGLSRRTA